MARFLKLILISVLLAGLGAAVLALLENRFSANVIPEGESSEGEPFADEENLTDEQREMLMQELKSHF